MSDMSTGLDRLKDHFGYQEGICEAGVFVLKAQGWWIWRRRRFTQMGTAMEWAEGELKLLVARKRFRRYRMSFVTPPQESLEKVLEQYEKSRLSGDPDFIDLPPDGNAGL